MTTGPVSVVIATGCLTTFLALAKFAVSAIIHQNERARPCVLARGKELAKYNKKRARELKHDRFRDTTMLLADKLADRVAGRGRQILYGLLALILIAVGIYFVSRDEIKRLSPVWLAVFGSNLFKFMDRAL